MELTDRQEEIISFISGVTSLPYPVKLDEMAFIGKYRKGLLFFRTYMAKCDCDFEELLLVSVNVGT